LQRAFLLRSCNDSVFSSRTRPCLLYQIKRCSGPCVGRVSLDDYGSWWIKRATFCRARAATCKRAWDRRCKRQRRAGFRARRRDPRPSARVGHVQGHQDINVAEIKDADVIVAHQAGGQTSVQVFFFRAGSNFGNRSYFPAMIAICRCQVMAGFMALFYANKLRRH